VRKKKFNRIVRRAVFVLLAGAFTACAGLGDARPVNPAADRGLVLKMRKQYADQHRVALVVGNSAYSRFGQLRNAVRDAKSISLKLEELGFEVITATDVDRSELMRVIVEFGSKLHADGVGLFYYSGHGIQVDGENYILPLNAQIEDEDDVRIEAVEMYLVLNYMRKARSRLNLVLLDACRNNPFSNGSRSAARGLAPMDAPEGTLVAYATGKGQTADDGDGDHSPFTAALLEELDVQGRPIEGTLKAVTRSVKKATDGKQRPWQESSFTGEFSFLECPAGQFYNRQAASCVGTGEVAGQTESVAHNPQKPGTNSRDNKKGPSMRRIPAGTFQMGYMPAGYYNSQDKGETGRTVSLPAFYIDETEVTVAQYRRCVDAQICTAPNRYDANSDSHSYYCTWNVRGKESHPVNCVTWQEANDFCTWAGKRLPTAEEWEYAARGADGFTFPWGNETLAMHDVQNVCWQRYFDSAFITKAERGTCPVFASKLDVNAFGVRGMAGNVREWTTTLSDTPESSDAEQDYMSGGGSFYTGDPRHLHLVVPSGWTSFNDYNSSLGFRCVK
jgi:uncharacterized caspase-like protein